MTTGVYAITNTVSGKIYVGQAQNVEKRWNDHASYLSRGAHINRHLQAAWNKYGESAFEFSVIECCLVDDLNAREMYHIALWKSQGLCYNQTDGGGGSRGRVPTAEHRAKIGEANKNPSDETRAKNSAAKMGNQNSLGHVHTEESKAKISASKRNMSDESRAKISESAKAREAAKKAAAAKGKVPSDETRQRMSAAQKARWAAKNDNDLP